MLDRGGSTGRVADTGVLWLVGSVGGTVALDSAHCVGRAGLVRRLGACMTAGACAVGG